MRLMASKLTWVALAALFLVPATALAAAPPLQNGGFEANLDNWVGDNTRIAVTPIFFHRAAGAVRGDFGVPIQQYDPKEGFNFAVLLASSSGPIPTSMSSSSASSSAPAAGA